MSAIREAAAGVVCLGLYGLHAQDFDPRLFSVPFAGFVLFARNVESVEQTAALTRDLQSRAGGLPYIVAIDQEGGRVARIRTGVEEIPSMMALAAAGDEDLAYRAGVQLGYDLRRAGVNVDFAPVLDLALFEQNTVIGARSFGDDPERVARYAEAVARGLRDAGVLPTYKHFPGHGSTAVDSHLDLPVIDLPQDVLRSRDLAPFHQLLQRASAVMTAHIIVQAFDAQRAATVSKRVLGELLRETCGFSGVCFTDCVEMDAIAKGIGSVAGAVASLQAGADCVLVSRNLDLALDIVDAIERAAEDGSLPLERLTQAYERVCALRGELRRCSQEPPLDVSPHPGIGREIGRRAVTLLRGTAAARIGDTLVLSFEGTTTEGVQGTHSDHAPLHPQVEQLRVPLEPQPQQVDAALERIRAAHKRPVVLMRRAHVYPAQREAVDRVLDAFPDALVVSVREPYDAMHLERARNVACTYGDDLPSMQGLADVVFGGAAPAGTLPLQTA